MNLENKTLLVCIAHHYNPEKIKYLKKIIERFLSYDLSVTIIIDTNSDDLLKLQYEMCYNDVFIYVHANLRNPYHLAWKHRKHMKNLIDDFDYFMYIEDDMDLPFENFVEYLNNFELLFPNYIPSFVRLEELEGKYYIVDMKTVQKINDYEIIVHVEKRFISLIYPYCSIWIMPTKELKETMTDYFVKESINRENAASYTKVELRKKPLVMLDDDNKISPLCYSYHLPNTYVNKKGNKHKFGRIEIGDVLEKI